MLAVAKSKKSRESSARASRYPRRLTGRLSFIEDFEIADQNLLGAVEGWPGVGRGIRHGLPEKLGVSVVGQADDDLSANWLAVDLKVDVVVLLAPESNGVRGQGPDLLVVDRDVDRDVPAWVKVAVCVGNVDLGLERARGRVE